MLEPPPGVAICAGRACAPGHLCCLATGLCFDPERPRDCPTPPRDADPGACASNADCTDAEYCAGPWLSHGGVRCAGATGICRPRDDGTSCSGGDGVCGCDGRTYAHLCEAAAAGVGVAHPVPCGSIVGPIGMPGVPSCSSDAECGDGWRCDGEAGLCVQTRPLVACGTDEQCASAEHCCAASSTCMPVACPSCCRVPPEGTFYPCTADDECAVFDPPGHYGEGYYCDGPGCSGPGGCRSLGRRCGGELSPVCGCDGVTYANPCGAQEAGVRVMSEGECPAG